MILYFSGTGNSAYAAQRIGAAIGDTVVDLFEKIKGSDYSQLHSDSPWVIVTPTYAWRIPRIVQNWLEHTHLAGSRDIYFVMTCGDSFGNAGKYLQTLCKVKDLHYMGCMEVIMPENYIAMYSAPQQAEALGIIRKTDSVIDRAAELIKGKKEFPEPVITLRGKIRSSLENTAFYPIFVHAKQFYSTDACISCGTCVGVCPLSNVKLEAGRPVWGNQCTHCMACICHCPSEAIEYGKHSKGEPRYLCEKVVQNQTK